MRAVPEAAVSGVSETLKENGLAAPPSTGGTTFLQAKTAHEVLKAQERRIRLSKLKGELVDRDRAKAMVFKLAREERDAWVTWPARVEGFQQGWMYGPEHRANILAKGRDGFGFAMATCEDRILAT